MKFLDLTFSAPAENLAGDEALLGWREESGGDGILRFWESPETFVVVGYANKIEAEVNVAGCKAGNITILRRCSGGGTVLQGRGCLNYALVLEIGGNPELANISSANRYIMERNRAAVQSVMGDSRVIKVQGHTDLACSMTDKLSLPHESVQDSGSNDSSSLLPSPAERGGIVHRRNSETQGQTFRKFSGNSQRRHKNFLLFHGTFLLDFNLALVGECLKFPSRQPDYRSSRSHREFLMNLNVPAAVMKTALQKIWQAEEPLKNPPLDKISRLAREKYAMREWNLKF
jgi:lipoate---protein ligase